MYDATVINPALLDQDIYFEGIASIHILGVLNQSPVLSMLTFEARRAIASLAASGLTVSKASQNV